MYRIYDNIAYLRLPGLLPGARALISIDPMMVPQAAGELLCIQYRGRDHLFRTIRDLDGWVSLQTPEDALGFCRFLTSPGTRHLFTNPYYRPEIVPRSRMADVLFRRDGEDVAGIKSNRSSGREGIVSDAGYARLAIQPPSVRLLGRNWVVNRTCMSESHEIVSRWNNGYAVQRIEEHVSRNGRYAVRVISEWNAPVWISWQIHIDL